MQSHPKKPFSIVKSTFFTLILIAILGHISPLKAQSEHQSDSTQNPTEHKATFKVSKVIIEHVLDNHVWHFFDGHWGTLFLPVIVYSDERGLEMFTSLNFYDEHHQSIAYNGYTLEHNKIELNGKSVWDFSITKNVAMLFLNAGLILFIMTSVARSYKRNAGKAPKGLQ